MGKSVLRSLIQRINADMDMYSSTTLHTEKNLYLHVFSCSAKSRHMQRLWNRHPPPSEGSGGPVDQ